MGAVNTGNDEVPKKPTRKLDPFKDLDKRARLALRQALQDGSGSGAAPSEVVTKLERKQLVRRSGHTYEAQEWGKVVRRWPSFALTEEGVKIAKAIVAKLYGPSDHSTIKTAAQLDAEIAEALRAKKWQEQVEREDRDRRARIAGTTGPTPDQLYEERAADVAAGVFHGERRGRARSFRKIASTAEALQASEIAKRRSDDVFDAAEHRTAAEAHRSAARLHKSDPAGADAAWLHDLAASNHRQAATARASRALKTADPSRTQKTFAAFQEKLSAANEHTTMAQEYARQALVAARRRM